MVELLEEPNVLLELFHAVEGVMTPQDHSEMLQMRLIGGNGPNQLIAKFELDVSQDSTPKAFSNKTEGRNRYWMFK